MVKLQSTHSELGALLLNFHSSPKTFLGFVGFVVIDEAVGRTVVASNITGGFKFGQNQFGQLFTELNTPLVETVDVPDGTLSKNLHFVHGDQTTQCSGCELLKQEAIGRAVSFKHLVRDKITDGLRLHLSFQFLTNGVCVFPESHRLRLGEKVWQQNRMMVCRRSNIFGQVILRLDRCQKVTWDQFGTLVD